MKRPQNTEDLDQFLLRFVRVMKEAGVTDRKELLEIARCFVETARRGGLQGLTAQAQGEQEAA